MFDENYSLEETGILYWDIIDYKRRQSRNIARIVDSMYRETEEARKSHNEIVDRIFGKSE